MDRMLTQTATPCPIPSSASQNFHHDSTFDDTTDIDFTSTFRASFRNVKPRRRQTTIRKPFAIHEDDSVQRDAQSNAEARETRQSTVVEQSAQRLQHRASLVPAHTAHETRINARKQDVPNLSHAPKRPLPDTSLRKDEMSKDVAGKAVQGVTKQARRQTIFIPSDNTTMPSMFLGIFSPIRKLEKHVKEEGNTSDVSVTGIAAQMAMKRRPRGSVVGAAARRGPLLNSSRVLQDSAVHQDRIGQGDGKENVPPGSSSVPFAPGSWDKKDGLMECKPQSDSVSRSSAAQKSSAVRSTSVYAHTASSKLKQELPSDKLFSRASSNLQTKRPWKGACRSDFLTDSRGVRRSVEAASFSPMATSVASRKPAVPSRMILPVLRVEPVLQKYPILDCDVANVEMYEDDWLAHQEIAITQLVNNLFETSSPGHHDSLDQGLPRTGMHDLYNDNATALLHRRLQAALLYGALSIPKDILHVASRLQTDLGRRKDFTDLWLDTYNLRTLTTALEVVVGRECLTRDSNNSLKSRRSVQRFLETFLIRNEDSKPPPDTEDHVAWSYRRTLLRSLMLVRLLDQWKSAVPNTSSTCLFVSSSAYKSSSLIVQELIKLLNPAAGDPMRPLNLLGYEVHHVQEPLQEHTYHIDNLAIDLRNGILLTRIVELLLYPTSSTGLERAHDADATTTIWMPDGEELLVDNGRKWPLSEHLKLPCLSRTTKLYNVQIALGALQGVRGMTPLLEGLQAGDIVDGYREKTMKLLWGLTGKWGLAGLVDWNDVRLEIKRLRWLNRCQGLEDDCNDVDEDDSSQYEMCKALLKTWARTVAGAHAVTIHNFTTSFADGKAFTAIVDEYEPYLSIDTSSEKRSLQYRLTRLGCSISFARLFSTDASSPQVHIFDRDFVLAALAFLCSRLLGPSRQIRAAQAIQRGWRAHWHRVRLDRQKQASTMALACAEAVQRRTKSETAARKIWVAWQAYKCRSVQKRQLDTEQKSGDEAESDIWLSL